MADFHGHKSHFSVNQSHNMSPNNVHWRDLYYVPISCCIDMDVVQSQPTLGGMLFLHGLWLHRMTSGICRMTFEGWFTLPVDDSHWETLWAWSLCAIFCHLCWFIGWVALKLGCEKRLYFVLPVWFLQALLLIHLTNRFLHCSFCLVVWYLWSTKSSPFCSL